MKDMFCGIHSSHNRCYCGFWK